MQNLAENSEICSGVKVVKTIFNFATILLVSPYLMKTDKNGNIIMSSNCYVKVGFTLIHATSLLFLCWRTTNIFQQSVIENQSNFLGIVFALWMIYNIVILDLMLFRMQGIVDLLHMLNSISTATVDLQTLRRPLIWAKVPWFLGIFISAWFLLDLTMMVRTSDVTFSGLWKSMINSAYQQYLPLNYNNFSLNDEDYFKVTHSMVGISYVILHSALTNLARWGFLFVSCFGFAFLISIQETLDYFHSHESNKNLLQIVETTEKFEAAFKKFSDVLWFVKFFSVFGFLPSYSVKLPLLYSGDILWTIDLGITFITMTSVLFPAAQVHSMMKSFVPLIQSCYREDDACGMKSALNMRANLIVQNIHANSMGLSGKAFVVTYSFVGSFCGLVLTYAILLSKVTPTVFDLKS